MSNRIDCTYTITRDPESGVITRIQWLVERLCDHLTADSHTPREVVYLQEGFGEGSPQVLNFALGKDEFALDMNADGELAQEIYEYLRTTKHVTISSTVHKAANITEWDLVTWTVPVTAYPDYLAMLNEMAALSSQAAARTRNL